VCVLLLNQNDLQAQTPTALDVYAATLVSTAAEPQSARILFETTRVHILIVFPTVSLSDPLDDTSI
jgi:hypothetical protein